MAALRTSLPDGLLDDVKNNLDITWSDEAEDAKVSGYIASGMIYINSKLGKEADYTADGFPRLMLMEWARYARAEALDVFESNYLSLILSMQESEWNNVAETESTEP